MSNQQHSDEIDLGELLLKFTRIIGRNKILIIVLSIMGILGGFIYYSIKTPVYESSMMIRSGILTEAYSETLTDNLKKLIEERNDTLLSKKLNISVEQAAHLKDIKVESVEDTESAEGATKNYIFLISVEITNNDILENLEVGIVSFLENNEFVSKRIGLKKKRLNSLIEKVNNELKEIDSLKRNVNQAITLNRDGGVVVMDPTNVYSKALSLYKEELSYQEGLELIDSIQLIEGFTAFNQPVSPKQPASILAGLGLSLFLAFVLIFIRETSKYLKSIDK